MKILFLLILSLLGFQACAEMCDERGPVGGGICTKDDECNKDRVTERKKDKRGDTTTERIIKDYNTQFGKNYCDLSITIKNITKARIRKSIVAFINAPYFITGAPADSA